MAEASGGVLIFGSTSIVYIASSQNAMQNRVVSIPIAFDQVQAACQVDTCRFLIADEYGGLHVLALQITSGAVSQMTIDMLGETSRASSICYLDDGLVYVGSAFGDSQLVRLLPEPGLDRTTS